MISQVYPDYSPKQGIMRAPVIRMTIGDYLYRVPGFLESVNVTVDNNYPWEVNLEKSQVGDVAQLPQVMDISVSFKPIMDILPKRASINKLIEATSATNNTSQETTTISTSIPALIANIGNKTSPEQSFIKPGEVVESTSRYVASKPLTFVPPLPAPNQFASQFERQNNLNIGG